MNVEAYGAMKRLSILRLLSFFSLRNKYRRVAASPAALARRRRLRALLSPAKRTPFWARVSFARVGIAVVTAALLSVLLCIHLLPNRVSFQLGENATRDISAQRTIRYENTAATRDLRRDAVRHVQKRYDLAPDAAESALDALRNVFDALESGVSRVGASPNETVAQTAARMTERIRTQADVSVTRDAVAVLLKQDASTRKEVRAVASRLVERAMTRAMPDDGGELAEARRDLLTAPELSRFPNPVLRRAVAQVAGAVLMPNQQYNPRDTARARQAAAASVVPQMRRLAAGAIVIRAGEQVTQQHLDAFAALGLQNARLDAATMAVIACLVVLLVSLVSAYLSLFHRDLFTDTPRLLLLALLTVISVIGLKIGQMLLGLPLSGVHVGYLGMMCVASAGMAIALLLSPSVAVLVVALLSVASGLILNNELRFTLITLGSSLVGIISVAQLKNRGDLVRAMFFLCGANAVLNVLAGQLEGDTPRELLFGMLWGVVSGLFALALFWVGVAVFEKWFGITTHLRLLELSDPATPILQEFRLRVPGTYAHSLMVGNLAHAAAEAIGGDGLLVRVAAYYHDLGKMNRPEFFIENQANAENIHDRISPSLSALVLASHVKEGVEMAKNVGLPPRVREVIEQHHGTTLMKYFYHRATGGIPNPSLEAQFRYPGPKPQSREAAVLMLADGVEAASRTLDKPTPGRIADFVAHMIEDKRADGQLDDCDLTLRDLKTIQDVFARTLSGTLHARIAYPSQAKQNAALTVAVAEETSESALSLSQLPPVPLTLATYGEENVPDADDAPPALLASLRHDSEANSASLLIGAASAISTHGTSSSNPPRVNQDDADDRNDGNVAGMDARRTGRGRTTRGRR